MFEQFFVTDVDPAKLVSGTYDPWLVMLSVFLASMASFFALRLAAAARHIVIAKYRRMALFSGAFILAGGIWSMHFIGMLAFTMPHSMEYDPWVTILSLLPAVIASYIVLKSLIDETDSLRLTLRNGLIVGGGIGTMHYVGMAAMRMDMALRYDPFWFVMSIAVAVILAFIALTARRVLRKQFPALRNLHVKLISAVIMGAAISGMHYTGMQAARFIDQMACVSAVVGPEDHHLLALAVAVLTLLISILAMNVSSQLRYRQLLSEKTSSEARLKAILDTATDGVMTINGDGEIQGVNSVACEIFGWQEQEMLKRNVSMLMPSHYQPQPMRYLHRFIGAPREVYARHRNGNLIPVRLGVGQVNLEDGGTLFVGFIADISQRKAMEKKLRDSEERLSSLMQNIPGASFRRQLDHGWTPIYLSEGVIELCGYPAETLLSGEVRYFDCLFAQDRAQLCDNIRHSLDERETYEIEYRVTHKDGHTVWVLENGMIVRDEAGNVLWSDGVMVDISGRKQMESELLEAKQRAEDAAESKASFLANMSHEIRTPMNAIIGFTDILLDSNIQGENRRHLQTICQSSRSLLHLLNDILDSAKLEKNKLDIEPIAFKLSACVDTVISTLWLSAKSKGIELELTMADSLPDVVEGAEDRIRQVLMNLVGNGIKFTEHGRVTLSVEPVAGQSDWIRFSIIDTGIGIAPERVNAIFEPFTQADASMSRRFGGTGLGTSISKQLVELMGGRIFATSQLGQGSCFTIELPLAESELNATITLSHLVVLPHLRVLVCDDIEQNINLLRILFERQGHTVFTAQDGLEAVSQFRAVRPDVVLMDIQMPNLDGLGASREIRHWEAERQFAPTPIIALTASVLVEDRVQAREAGMTGFANKPVEFAQLTQEIARVLAIDPQMADVTARAGTEATAEALRIVHRHKAITLWGDETVYATELAAWHAKQGDVSARLKALTEQGAWGELAEQAHALKGLAGNLALMPLFHAFTQLEKSADAHLPAQTLEIVAEIAGDWEALAQDISKLQPLGERVTAKSEPAQIDDATLLVHLNAWMHATQAGELRDDLAAILHQGSSDLIKKQIVEAKNAIDEFDFKAAVQAMQIALNLIQ